jgi:hypothetical protein
LSSVNEYSKKFNHLSQYGSYHADTDENKISLFRQGLSPMLHEHLTLFWSSTLNELVNASIEQEDVCRAHLEEERKKRHLPRPTGGTPPKYRLVYTPLLASQVVLLHRSSGATIHLSRWPHILQSTCGWLLHLELYSRLG